MLLQWSNKQHTSGWTQDWTWKLWPIKLWFATCKMVSTFHHNRFFLIYNKLNIFNYMYSVDNKWFPFSLFLFRYWGNFAILAPFVLYKGETDGQTKGNPISPFHNKVATGDKKGNSPWDDGVTITERVNITKYVFLNIHYLRLKKIDQFSWASGNVN